MANIISENAYGILGLLPSASQKELSRRLKEIEKLLSIDELPEYDFDFNIYNKARNAKTIQGAFLSISNVNTQVMQNYFRIYANSEKQIKILEDIEKEFTYENIIDIYKNIDNKNFIFDKNIAILLTILIITGKIKSLKEPVTSCIDMWHSIIFNEKYAKDFKKIFLLDDEIGINETVFEGIKDRLISELTKVFSDLSKQYKNNKILSMFIDRFELNNNIFNIDIVEEIYSEIQKNINTMDSMHISEDGIFDKQEKCLLKKCLNSFQNSFNKLIDLGLYDNEKTIIIRDLVATKIRIQILDLFNNLSEDEIALNLMKFAVYIVGTDGLKEKLTNELKILNRHNLPIETINIGKSKTLTIYNNYITINDKKISFDEIQSISFLSQSTKTNGVETKRIYFFELGIKDHLFNLTQNLGLFSNKSDGWRAFSKLLNLSGFIIPIMAEKFYASLQAGNILRIDNLYITKDFYYIRKWNGNRIVYFSPELNYPSVKDGEVTLYDANKFSFYTISLQYSNAPVLVELIKMLIDKNVDLSNVDCKFKVSENYGLHIFYPEKETDWERRRILFWDFLRELFAFAFLIALLGGILYFIIGLFRG